MNYIALRDLFAICDDYLPVGGCVNNPSSGFLKIAAVGPIYMMITRRPPGKQKIQIRRKI